jgi:hypothetical protein
MINLWITIFMNSCHRKKLKSARKKLKKQERSYTEAYQRYINLPGIRLDNAILQLIEAQRGQRIMAVHYEVDRILIVLR